MNQPNKIIIHHTVYRDTPGLETDDVDRMHTGQGWRGIGYHGVVEEIDGEIHYVAGRPLWMTGSHCPGHNNSSIGVVLMGDFTEEPPPEAMLDEAAQHVAGLCHVAGIPATEIYPHHEFKATACPGDSFPWEEFVELVEDYLP